MKEKALKTIKKYNMITPGDTVLVALSGGPDSVALLHLLWELRDKLKIQIGAIHIDHQIRPQASAKESKLCQRLCDRLHIELMVVTENIPELAKRKKKGLEEAARDFRYLVFKEVVREEGLNRVALGHNADDQAETILFRIIRGTGLSGLTGIPPVRDNYIRPLIDCTRAEIEKYVKRHKLPFAIDSSNTDPRFKRNYIRHKLLPEIRKNLNPAVDRALLNLAETASIDDATIAAGIAAKIAESLNRTPGGKLQLDLNRFWKYDDSGRNRIIRHCLTVLSADSTGPDKVTVERLLDFAKRGTGSVSLPGKVQATRARDYVVFHKREKLKFRTDLSLPGTTRIDVIEAEFKSSLHGYRGGKIRTVRGAKTVVLDYDKLEPPLAMRSIRPGDRFAPLGMKGSKKIGDYLTDKRVPNVYRDEIPVLTDRKGVVWLVGYEIADRVKIDKKTRKVVRIGQR